MKSIIYIVLLLICSNSFTQYPPAAGVVGTTAIHKDSSIIVGWADKVLSFNPGPQDISTASPLADFGDSTNALAYAEGNSSDVVSLGDGGSITLGFPFPIMNGSGFDFVIFENSFSNDFLEFAHVEVSSDGLNFIRIPSHSLVQVNSQTGSFGTTLTSEINNLAGKYQQAYGTPFDLEDIIDSTGIDLDSIQYVRIIDVVGSINPSFGSVDSYGNYINEPFPTFFPSGGFDLDAVGMINVNGVYTAEVYEGGLDYSVYPNPATSYLKIQVSNDTESSLSLFNLNGQLVFYTIFKNNIQLNLLDLDLQHGMYIISITNGEECIKKKLVFK